MASITSDDTPTGLITALQGTGFTTLKFTHIEPGNITLHASRHMIARNASLPMSFALAFRHSDVSRVSTLYARLKRLFQDVLRYMTGLMLRVHLQ
jgi:hypothetical protein